MFGMADLPQNVHTRLNRRLCLYPPLTQICMDPSFLFFRFGSVNQRKVKQFDDAIIRFFAVSALRVAFCFECEFVSIQLLLLR